MSFNLSKIRDDFTYSLVDLTLKAHADAKIVGPIFHEEHAGSKLWQRMLDFRKKNTEARAPYLYSKEQKAIDKELQIDERSAHFVIATENEIMAYLRLTPRPFELSKLDPKWIDAEKRFDDFYELSRLATTPKIKSRALYARLLLLGSGLWLFNHTDCQGIIAVCREDKLKYFSQFGLRAFFHYKSYLEARESYYHIISANKERIFLKVINDFIKRRSKKIFRPRFDWSSINDLIAIKRKTY